MLSKKNKRKAQTNLIPGVINLPAEEDPILWDLTGWQEPGPGIPCLQVRYNVAGQAGSASL